MSCMCQILVRGHAILCPVTLCTAKNMFAGACLFVLIVKLLHFVFVEHAALTPLASKASHRSQHAFRPKTRAYHSMFRVFVAFCIFSEVLLVDVNVKVILAFLECLVQNKCSFTMVKNYVSAIKASFILYELPYVVFNHPQIKYFIKSLKINRPLTLRPHNLIDLTILRRISIACLELPYGVVYGAVFLTGFFAFMRLSNLAPPFSFHL